jgi:N-methylhydantoinase B
VLESMAGPDERIHIRVAIRIEGDEAVADFSGTDPQVAEPVNAVLPITVSAVLYCFLCLLDDEVPVNAGCFRPLRIDADEGSVVNALPPAAVSAGNVETSQRIVDVVFRALAQAVPDLVPAAGQGTMNNVTFGGYDPGRDVSFAYYETLGGGMGASPLSDGLSGVHVAMSNTLNTPVEALESELPVEIRQYRLRKSSGGAGRQRGGDGLERSYRFLVPVRGSVVSERRAVAPWGLQGGSPGKPGRNTLNGVEFPSKAEFSARAGDVLTIETPGGGGFGKDEG